MICTQHTIHFCSNPTCIRERQDQRAIAANVTVLMGSAFIYSTDGETFQADLIDFTPIEDCT